jgi:hypothetical protein
MKMDIGQECSRHLFQLVLVCAYICLFSSKNIMIYGSKEPDGNYPFDPISVITVAETIKFLFSLFLSLRETKSLKKLFIGQQVPKESFVPLLTFSFLNIIHSNLIFINLEHYDPITYVIFLNFETVITGIIFEVSFLSLVVFRFSKKCMSTILGAFNKTTHYSPKIFTASTDHWMLE